MRITNSMMVDGLLKNLNTGLTQLSKYNEQLSSNKKMNHLSDDPVGVLKSMDVRQKLQRIGQYQSNLESARNWVDQADSTILEMNSVVTTIQENVNRAATGTLNASDKQNIGVLVGQMRDQLMQMANTTMGSQFIFAGYNSTTTPFTVDASGNVQYNGVDLSTPGTTPILGKAIADTANATGFTWSGPISAVPDQYSISVDTDTITIKNSKGAQILSRQITTASGANELDLTAQGLGKITWTDNGSATAGEVAAAIGSAGYVSTDVGLEAAQKKQYVVGYNISMGVTFNGAELAGTGENNMFKILNDVVNALNNNASSDEISAFLTPIQNISNNLLQKSVETGARSQKIDTLLSRYSQDTLNYQSIKSDVEDIDQAEAITNYKLSQAVYEQALAVGAKIITPTLMDFLK